MCYGTGNPATTFVMLDPAGNLVDFLHCPQFRCGGSAVYMLTGMHCKIVCKDRAVQGVTWLPVLLTHILMLSHLHPAPTHACPKPNPTAQRPHPQAQGCAGSGVQHVRGCQEGQRCSAHPCLHRGERLAATGLVESHYWAANKGARFPRSPATLIKPALTARLPAQITSRSEQDHKPHAIVVGASSPEARTLEQDVRCALGCMQCGHSLA